MRGIRSRTRGEATTLERPGPSCENQAPTPGPGRERPACGFLAETRNRGLVICYNKHAPEHATCPAEEGEDCRRHLENVGARGAGPAHGTGEGARGPGRFLCKSVRCASPEWPTRMQLRSSTSPFRNALGQKPRGTPPWKSLSSKKSSDSEGRVLRCGKGGR